MARKIASKLTRQMRIKKGVQREGREKFGKRTLDIADDPYYIDNKPKLTISTISLKKSATAKKKKKMPLKKIAKKQLAKKKKK